MKWIIVMMLLILALFVDCDDADGGDIRSGWSHNHWQNTGIYSPYQYRYSHYPSYFRYRSLIYDYRMGRDSYYRRTYPVWNPQPVYRRQCYPIRVR